MTRGFAHSNMYSSSNGLRKADFAYLHIPLLTLLQLILLIGQTGI